ncbi:MAG: hypothetical protein HC904_13835 [Blastochloris sp.]|nr:hypothetical protein [Blastochloris sp.]
MNKVQAVTFDWDMVDWGTGNLTQSFDFDPSNPGNDITITISGDTGTIKSPHSGSNFSPDDNELATGGFAGEETLLLSVDFTQDNGNQSLIVTIQFHYVYGVDNTSFILTDVDRNTTSQNFIDVISDWDASYGAGPSFYPTLTPSASNFIGGTNGTSTVFAEGSSSNPDNASGGNVTVSLTNSIDQISFIYTSGNVPSSSNPTSQSIGLHDITFTPAVPEPSTWITGGLLLLWVLYSQFRRRNRLACCLKNK